MPIVWYMCTDPYSYPGKCIYSNSGKSFVPWVQDVTWLNEQVRETDSKWTETINQKSILWRVGVAKLMHAVELGLFRFEFFDVLLENNVVYVSRLCLVWCVCVYHLVCVLCCLVPVLIPCVILGLLWVCVAYGAQELRWKLRYLSCRAFFHASSPQNNMSGERRTTNMSEYNLWLQINEISSMHGFTGVVPCINDNTCPFSIFYGNYPNHKFNTFRKDRLLKKHVILE